MPRTITMANLHFENKNNAIETDGLLLKRISSTPRSWRNFVQNKPDKYSQAKMATTKNYHQQDKKKCKDTGKIHAQKKNHVYI